MKNDPLAASLTVLVTALRVCADAVESLVRTMEEASPKSEQWPDLMPTTVAARYCGYRSAAGLRKARFDGKVFPAGRRGGAGAWTWARADLDAFLRGEAPARKDRVPPADGPSPRPRSKRGGSGRHSKEVEEALRRIKEIRRKPRP